MQRWTDGQLRWVVQSHGAALRKSVAFLSASRCVLHERMVSELFALRLDRKQDTLADLNGLELLQRTKIDPSGMIRFIERLLEKDEGT